MRRITLEEMSRFKSLDHFFQRGRWAKGHPGETKLRRRDAAGGHRYAHASQTVNNNGGYTWLNNWDPDPSPGLMSLSQCWYAAYNSAGQIQTVECGWQVLPIKYNTSAPVLFSYWTADGYQNTGNYNLDAPAFVQTNNAWVLGGAFVNWTTPGGGQNTGFGVEYNQDPSGNWWLFLGGGAGSSPAIGYYPASLWSGTQMASFATMIDYGGEVAPSDGSAATGQMGSGACICGFRKRCLPIRDRICTTRSNGADRSHIVHR
jgi:Neprosin